MSRSPIAREVMRSLLEKSDFAGEVVVFPAGVTKAYEDCPIDKRIQEFLSFARLSLADQFTLCQSIHFGKSDLVVTLDHESEEFSRVRKQAIQGETRPLGVFMAPGCEPYVAGPL